MDKRFKPTGPAMRIAMEAAGRGNGAVNVAANTSLLQRQLPVAAGPALALGRA